VTALDGARNVDVAEDDHLVACEEHLPRPAVDLHARRLGHVLRRPGAKQVERAAGEHRDAGAVVLDEVRLVHTATWVLVVLTLVGPTRCRTGRNGARPIHPHRRTDRNAAPSDEVVALPDLLEAALHLQDQRILDGRLELIAAGDLCEERAPVDASGAGRALLDEPGSRRRRRKRPRLARAERVIRISGEALRTAPWTARHPFRARAAWGRTDTHLVEARRRPGIPARRSLLHSRQPSTVRLPALAGRASSGGGTGA
jgi:hypothetical protein